MGSGVGVMGPIIKHVILPSFVFALACIGLYFAIKSVDHKSLANSLTNALTNLAAVGGIASGLSFASLSIFTLNGTYQKKVLASTGNCVRQTLFYLLFIIMLVSIFSGISVVWAEQGWMRFAFPVLVFVVLESFYLTFRIVFIAYEWESQPDDLPPIKDEYLQK